MAEIPSIFAQAIYKNVINWKVEDVIYLTILSKIRKHFKDEWDITYDYIFLQFFDILRILHDPQILGIWNQ